MTHVTCSGTASHADGSEQPVALPEGFPAHLWGCPGSFPGGCCWLSSSSEALWALAAAFAAFCGERAKQGQVSGGSRHPRSCGCCWAGRQAEFAAPGTKLTPGAGPAEFPCCGEGKPAQSTTPSHSRDPGCSMSSSVCWPAQPGLTALFLPRVCPAQATVCFVPALLPPNTRGQRCSLAPGHCSCWNPSGHVIFNKQQHTARSKYTEHCFCPLVLPPSLEN